MPRLRLAIPGVSVSPRWSPDGRKIALVRVDCDCSTLTGPCDAVCVVWSDATRFNFIDAWGYWPQWDASSEVVFYTKEGQIWSATLDGQKMLILPHKRESERFYLSPNRKRIAFWDRPELESDRNGRASSYVENQVLYVVNTDGSDLRHLLAPGQYYGLSWASDSRRVVFRGEGIEVVDVLTGERRVVADHGIAPACSPNGNKVAIYTSLRSRLKIRPGVHILDLDSGRYDTLHSFLWKGGMRGYRDVFSWSSDGRFLAYPMEKYRFLHGRSPGIYLARVPDGSITKLLEGRLEADSPIDWSPEGMNIALSLAMRSESSLQILNVASEVEEAH